MMVVGFRLSIQTLQGRRSFTRFFPCSSSSKTNNYFPSPYTHLSFSSKSVEPNRLKVSKLEDPSTSLPKDSPFPGSAPIFFFSFFTKKFSGQMGSEFDSCIVNSRAGGCDDGLHLWQEKGYWSCSLVGTPPPHIIHFFIFVFPNCPLRVHTSSSSSFDQCEIHQGEKSYKNQEGIPSNKKKRS